MSLQSHSKVHRPQAKTAHLLCIVWQKPGLLLDEPCSPTFVRSRVGCVGCEHDDGEVESSICSRKQCKRVSEFSWCFPCHRKLTCRYARVSGRAEVNCMDSCNRTVFFHCLQLHPLLPLFSSIYMFGNLHLRPVLSPNFSPAFCLRSSHFRMCDVLCFVLQSVLRLLLDFSAFFPGLVLFPPAPPSSFQLTLSSSSLRDSLLFSWLHSSLRFLRDDASDDESGSATGEDDEEQSRQRDSSNSASDTSSSSEPDAPCIALGMVVKTYT